MKRIRLVVLATVAALALSAAIASAASASPTVFCAAQSAPCPEKYVQPAGTTNLHVVNREFKLGKFQFNSSPQITCGYALLGATSTAVSGEPLPAKSILYANPKTCKLITNFGSTCTSFDVSDPSALVESTALSGNAGTIKFGNTSERVTISYDCTTEDNVRYQCTYQASGTSLMLQVIPFEEYDRIIKAPFVLTTQGEGQACAETATLTVEAWAEGGAFISHL